MKPGRPIEIIVIEETKPIRGEMIMIDTFAWIPIMTGSEYYLNASTLVI